MISASTRPTVAAFTAAAFLGWVLFAPAQGWAGAPADAGGAPPAEAEPKAEPEPEAAPPPTEDAGAPQPTDAGAAPEPDAADSAVEDALSDPGVPAVDALSDAIGDPGAPPGDADVEEDILADAPETTDAAEDVEPDGAGDALEDVEPDGAGDAVAAAADEGLPPDEGPVMVAPVEPEPEEPVAEFIPIGWTVMGFGGVLLASAIGMHFQAVGAANDAEEVANPMLDLREPERRALHEDAEDRRKSRTALAVVLYSLSAAAIGTGLALVLTEEIGSEPVGARIDIGPDGAVFGVGGSF